MLSTVVNKRLNVKDKFDIVNACFDDKRRITFARNYNLDPDDKDLDLLKKIHSITTIKRVYDAKQNSSESVVEYFNEIKDFITSEQYQNMNEAGKRCFENHVFEILKSIVIKGIGTEYFTTKAIHYLSKPNVNETLD